MKITRGVMNKSVFSKKRSFSTRSLVTFLLVFALVLMTVSSVVLFVLPHGRIAFWNDFRIWSMGKEQWETIHVVGGFLLLICSVVHLYFNWKVLISYLSRQKAALVAAILASLVFFAGSALELPPFTSLMDLSEMAKKSWKAEPPPVPHYEYKTLAELAQEEHTDLKRTVAKLKQAGIGDFNPDESLKDIAARHGLSPAELYQLMDGKRRRKAGHGSGKHKKHKQ